VIASVTQKKKIPLEHDDDGDDDKEDSILEDATSVPSAP